MMTASVPPSWNCFSSFVVRNAINRSIRRPKYLYHIYNNYYTLLVGKNIICWILFFIFLRLTTFYGASSITWQSMVRRSMLARIAPRNLVEVMHVCDMRMRVEKYSLVPVAVLLTVERQCWHMPNEMDTLFLNVKLQKGIVGFRLRFLLDQFYVSFPLKI